MITENNSVVVLDCSKSNISDILEDVGGYDKSNNKDVMAKKTGGQGKQR